MERRAVSEQVCWGCGAGTTGRIFCEVCQRIQPFPEHADYFSVLGLSRCMQIDPGDLEKRFHALSRRFHPDFFQNKSEREREISLSNSAALNRAYRTLRDPASRGAYLVSLVEGGSGQIPLKAPADLFEEILELQETLQEYRALQGTRPEREALGEKLVSVRADLQHRDQEFLQGLEKVFSQWDDLPEAHREAERGLVQTVKDLLSQRAYIGRVIHDIEQALGREG